MHDPHPTAAEAETVLAVLLPVDQAEAILAILAMPHAVAFVADVLGVPFNSVLTYRHRFWPDRVPRTPWTVADILTADLALALTGAGLTVTDAFTVARTAERDLQAWLRAFLLEPEDTLLALRPPARTEPRLWGCSLHRASEPPVHEGEVTLIVDISSIARAVMIRVATKMRRENVEGNVYGSA